MTFLHLIFLISLVAGTCTACQRTQSSKKLLLVSFDGFRWDYFKKTSTPNFDEIAKTGVKAPYLESTFNTKSYPAHYSIATGLYEENHGIMGNRMYDPEIGFFDRKVKSNVLDPRWWLGEPIWMTVMKNNKLARTYYWPGSEVARGEIWRNQAKTYNENVPFTERVDTVMEWFGSDGVDFATLYYHEPDKTGHVKGPDHPDIVEAIKQVDSDLGYLISQMKEKNLWDSVNLIIVSDHGMTTMKQVSNILRSGMEDIVNLEDILDPSDVQRISLTSDWGTICQIQPTPNNKDNLYNALKGRVPPNMTVYLKEDLPDRWHFKNSNRVLPIVIVPDEGFNVRLNKSDKFRLNDTGTHGYDNRLESMRAIFLARGPNFLSGHTTDWFSLVDIYPLMCEILGITPAPHDGSLEKVRSMLRQDVSAASEMFTPYKLKLGLVSITLMFLFI